MPESRLVPPRPVQLEPTAGPDEPKGHEAADAPSPKRSARFRTIDGLRGIAALGVVLFHFNGAISRSAPHWAPRWMSAIAEQGWMGVEIFFVISGFVIAYSVREGIHSGRYLALFALRRSIRLDPPYWFATFVEIGLILLSLAIFPSMKIAIPSGAQVASNMVYLQDILGYGGVLPVAWTLCYEIQFYLFFVGLLVIWRSTKHLIPTRSQGIVVGSVLAAVFIISIEVRYGGLLLPVRGLALERWFQFFLGVLSWWVVSRSIPAATVVLAYIAILVAIVAFDASWMQVLPIVISAGIVIVGRLDRLDTVLSNRFVQFLGKTSYSLYLLHGPIGWRWISLLERLVGPSFGVVWAWIAFFSACAISFGVSALAWKLLEAPSMRFSKRIKLPTRDVAPASPGLGQVAATTA